MEDFHISWTFEVEEPLFYFGVFLAVLGLYNLFKYAKKWWKANHFKKDVVAPNTAPEVWKTPVPGKINLYGDSIAYGGFVNPDKTFGRLDPTPAWTLRQLTGMEVDDRSISGDTLKSIYENRFFTDGHDGELTVIEAGINDTIQGYAVEERLRLMIEYELLHGRKVIVTGLSQNTLALPLQDKQNAAIKAVTERFPMTQVMWARWPEVIYYGEKDLKDGLHPDQGYSFRLMMNVYLMAQKLVNR